MNTKQIMLNKISELTKEIAAKQAQRILLISQQEKLDALQRKHKPLTQEQSTVLLTDKPIIYLVKG